MTYLMDLASVNMGIFSSNDGAFKLFNISLHSHDVYNERYLHIDPLRPINSANILDNKVSTLSQLALPGATASRDFYQEYTRSLGVADKAAMYLYHNNVVFAVISLVRGGNDGAFTPAMIEQLRRAQPLMEHLAAEIFISHSQTKKRTDGAAIWVDATGA